MDVNNVINYLKNSNKRTEETLIDGFVNEITVKYLPLYVFETLALNKEAQEMIINLSKSSLKIIAKIISYANFKEQDWIPLCSSFYHFLNNKKYSNLANELSNASIDNKLIENLLFSISNGGNYFNIKSIEDLKNLSNIRNKIAEKNNETYDPNILLLNKYGISYDTAYNLYLRYCKDVLELPESREQQFLLDIKNIIEGKGTEKNIFDDISFIINIDSILRNYFSKIYNNVFYRISEQRRKGTIDDIPIYDAGIDFNMCIYSYGMATEYPIPANYKSDWNRPNISTDYMCNSIISSSNMKTHVKHCVFGFETFNKNDLALLGANDLGTGGIYKELNVTNPFHQKKLFADVEFRVPNELINNTRFTNNEVYRLRRRVVDGKLERVNPDYIVYFKKSENYNEDPIWIESLNAAKDFNIPIVIIDCEKCLIHNVENIEKLLKVFEKRYDDANIVKHIIEKIYTINSGYRDLAPDLLDKYFNKKNMLSYLEKIMQHIDVISNVAPKTAIECIDMVLNTIDSEFEKVLKSPYWVEYARKQGYIIDKPIDIINIFKLKRKELEKISDYRTVNNQLSL